MSSQALGRRHEALTSVAFARTLAPTPPLVGRGPVQRAGIAVGDLLVLAGVVFCFPFAILAIGLPIALLVRLLLWLGQLL